jgi:hypothetical protein
MTYLAKLNSTEIYQLHRRDNDGSCSRTGTFRELSETLVAEMGCSVRAHQLVNGRWVAYASRRGREMFKSHQSESQGSAVLDLLVAFHCRMTPSCRRRYFRIVPAE